MDSLTVFLKSDFTDFIIPENSMAPKEKNIAESGIKLIWRAANLITGQNVAVKFYISGNYGKLLPKLFFYAPFALLLFLALLLIMSVSHSLNLHPMHYLFIMGGFLTLYLLGSYLVSYLPVVVAILMSLGVSSLLILYYGFLLKKDAILLRSLSGGVFVFQWIFSLAFFFPEHTGFIITISCILAFFGAMKITSSIDWENKW